jgi:surface antigen
MHTSTRFRLALAALALAAFDLTAMAQNVLPFGQGPLAAMTDADVKLMWSAIERSLDRNADGVAQEWRNPATGSHGAATPLDTKEVDGRPCRRLRIQNTAQGASGENTFTFCQQPYGAWKIVSEP